MNNNDHDKNSLENLELKKLPFKVGEGYFNGLSERISNAIDAEESDLKYNLHLKKSPFVTPEGYFDTLSASIETKLSVGQKELKFYQRPLTRWLAVAASLTLLITIYFNQPSSADSDLLANVSDETIISFLESENGINDEFLISVEEIDSVLDAIYDDETGIFVNTLESNPELEYDFEYFDY
ncbi:hypothetical protein [Roseivirga sp. E12]|uniref:hypothetical protein n=1 Tax=Roseivirga sp. E12 TaxID=2819237 RepID=UPI001ABCF1A0|nr:hypothetical protein [Roseivirga sp. E12]MBO3698410.1 hypothetical protein [Roseivirga sp. E12]